MQKVLDKVYVDDNIVVKEISGVINTIELYDTDTLIISGDMSNVNTKHAYNLNSYTNPLVSNGYVKITLPKNIGKFKTRIEVKTKKLIEYSIYGSLNESWSDIHVTTNTNSFLGNSSNITFCNANGQAFILIGGFNDVIDNEVIVNITQFILLDDSELDELLEDWIIEVENLDLNSDLINGDVDDTQDYIIVYEDFFNVDDILFIDAEQMKVLAVDELTLTVQRGFNNTTISSHLNGSAIDKFYNINIIWDCGNVNYIETKVEVSNKVIIDGEAEYNEESDFYNNKDSYIHLGYMYDQLPSIGNVKTIGNYIDNNLALFEGDSGNIIKDSGYHGFSFANKNDVLELDNTTPYEPINSHNPATKKFVDDNKVFTLQGFYTSDYEIPVGTNLICDSQPAVEGDSYVWNFKIYNEEYIRKGRLFTYLKNSDVEFHMDDDIRYLDSSFATVDSTYVANNININITNNSDTILYVKLWRQNIC